MSHDDRRRHQRFLSSLRCWIRGESRTVYVTIRDLSRGGLGIRAPTTFRPGDLAELVVIGRDEAPALRVRGEIAWSHPDPDNPEHSGTGVRFVEVFEGHELLPASAADDE